MRIATGSISHESSTFTTVETTWDSYRNQRFGYRVGEEIVDFFRGTNTAIGGFLAGAERFGDVPIPEPTYYPVHLLPLDNPDKSDIP